MAFAEEQLVTFATAGDFDPNIIVAAARPRLDSRVGGRVEVHADVAWYPAQIIAARSEELKVHYCGDDERVTSGRIREAARKVYPIGAAVEVQWKRKWYSAKVLEVRAGIHHTQYRDYGPEWNEWIVSKRIRQIA